MVRGMVGRQRPATWIAFVWCTALLLSMPALSAASPTTRMGEAKALELVVMRNIFVRDRHIEVPPPPPVQPSMRQRMVLTGIVIQNALAQVCIEDVMTRKVLRLKVGDFVAGGNIRAVRSNQILYEQDGVEIWISPGSDLTVTPASVLLLSR